MSFDNERPPVFFGDTKFALLMRTLSETKKNRNPVAAVVLTLAAADVLSSNSLMGLTIHTGGMPIIWVRDINDTETYEHEFEHARRQLAGLSIAEKIQQQLFQMYRIIPKFIYMFGSVPYLAMRVNDLILDWTSTATHVLEYQEQLALIGLHLAVGTAIHQVFSWIVYKIGPIERNVTT